MDKSEQVKAIFRELSLMLENIDGALAEPTFSKALPRKSISEMQRFVLVKRQEICALFEQPTGCRIWGHSPNDCPLVGSNECPATCGRYIESNAALIEGVQFIGQPETNSLRQPSPFKVVNSIATSSSTPPEQPQGAARIWSEDGLYGSATGANLPQPQGPEDISAEVGDCPRKTEEQAQPQDDDLREKLTHKEAGGIYNQLREIRETDYYAYVEAVAKVFKAAGYRKLGCPKEKWPMIPIGPIPTTGQTKVYTAQSEEEWAEERRIARLQRASDMKQCPAQEEK